MDVRTFVAGEWIEASDGRTRERFNPASTDELVARYPVLSDKDVRRAVTSARDAAYEWGTMQPVDRGRILLRTAQILRDSRDDIAADITREMGKTLAEASAEVSVAADFFEYYGGLARGPWGDVLGDRRGGVDTWTIREPLGVVVLITPWNDPLITPARKAAPALICGNAIILKPAAETPLSALHMMRALEQAGIPAGVVNCVTGPSSEIGPPLLENDAIDAVSFTGSTEVGYKLKRLLADRGTRLQTEMGGKNAGLVLKDADFDTALDAVIGASCGQAGQRCTALSRIIVEEPIADRFTDALVSRVGDLRVGRGSDPDTEVGPLVTESHLASVTDAIEKAKADGARVAVGGTRPVGDEYASGHFLQPTVIVDVAPHLPVWKEEIFGPVVSLVTAADLHQGIELVNDGRYGLSSAIYTTSLKAAHFFARQAQTGQVAINLPTIGWDVHIPFGGFKQSGSPFKEHGKEGPAFYTRVKSVAMRFE